MAWAIARAAVQSITIDEAITYNIFVFNRRYLWYAANNHILNSVLMYGFTKVFGLSQFTARLPALVGAAFYITAAYRLCRLLRASVFGQLTTFVCLVFNPFIFDYLVAARGYGLALGFLMWAIVYAAESHMHDGSLVAACAVSSLCAGMSVNANFSFAFVNLAAMAAILLWTGYQRPNQWIRLLAASVLPGAAVVAIVSGYALLHWHSGELIYGASSLGETFGSVIGSSLFQTRLDFLAPLLFPLVGVTGLAWLASSATRIAPLGRVAAAILAVTIAMHWLLFRLFGLLLPKDRTAVYLFPLFMIAASVLAAIPPVSRLGRSLRACFIGSLAILAIYFVSCLRLTYFMEWSWDSDVQRTYAVLSCLNREHQVTRVASSWPYHAPLSFYRLAQPTSLREIDENFDPQQTQVYVVDTLHTPDATQGKDLKIFYRSPTTDAVLAASPPLADAYAAGTCLRL
jgi:4-amino-4-deoxy-L-arabinose transferase-like glycosyltransferase